MLGKAGVVLPEETQFVSLHADTVGPEVAGMRQNGKTVGAVSVDHLIAVVHRFKVGIETHPKTVTLMGEWKAGESYNPDLL